MTVAGLARGMAKMADPSGLGATRKSAAERLVQAMILWPELVAGEGRACTELMRAMDGVAIKTGAEGVFIAILPKLGLGVALKIEDGRLWPDPQLGRNPDRRNPRGSCVLCRRVSAALIFPNSGKVL